MASLLHDVRTAARSLARSPGFAAVAAVTLALGIGANTAIFSVVDRIVLRPLPYRDPDRLVLVEHLRPDGRSGAVSAPNFRDFASGSRAFESLAAYRRETVALTSASPAQSLAAAVVTPNLFATLGVAPRVGRGFAEGEAQVVVLTDRGWRRITGGDPAAVGRTIAIDHQTATVIGVLPRDLRYVLADDVDVFLPLARPFDAALAAQRDAHYLGVVGRLAPGVTPAQASAELQAVAAAHPSNQQRTARAWPLGAKLTGPVRPALLVLAGAVGFVLLIACANVANLLLARATVRQRELAVRLALGAGRWRVMRLLLTESVLLALAGGALGALLAMWSLDALRELVPNEIARTAELGLDARVLGFTFVVALVTGVAFGLVPALSLSAQSPWSVLKEQGARGAAPRSRRRARDAFVVAEVAVATVLVVGAALMLTSFRRVWREDPGFRPDGLVVAMVSLPEERYADAPARRRFFRELEARLEGAGPVALGAPVPYLGPTLGISYDLPGREDEADSAPLHLVNRDYFRALGIPLAAGRAFTAADDADGAEPVAIVSENLARRHFGAPRDAVGQRIAIGWDDDGVVRRIVGVAGDVREKSLEAAPELASYIPFSQGPFTTISIASRALAAGALRDAVAAIDTSLPLSHVSTMDAAMSGALAVRRLNTLLLGVFGGLALALALVGAYGVMSYSVTQRTGEIGIRMALGARPGQVVSMVIGQGTRLAVLGVALGVAGALALSRALAGLLYGVSATDPAIYAAMAALFVSVVALASWIPARRAARVDPMTALRVD
jgi:putative ABC transport system permease protein